MQTTMGLECRLDYGRTMNYAMQQNHVPVIRKLWLHNGSEKDIEGVTVSIEATPAFAATWTKSLDVIPAGATVDIGVVDIRLSAVFLAELTERILGSLVVTVTREGAERETLLEESVPIEVLAFDEWSGLAVMPEMISSFVTPNHPEVTRMLRSAADLLKGWDERASFNAYQSKDQNQVRRQVAAIYAALQKEEVTYTVAPASFEPVGQRIRLLDALFQHRLGNCIDMTAAFAACLEAVGLHPLIIFTKGHAFVGVWLVEETFAECVQDDLSLLTKRLARGIHEVCMVETTAAMGRGSQAVSFEEASKLGEQSLLADPESFYCFVDVRRARASSIRPLPQRIAAPGGWEIRGNDPEPPKSEAAPSALVKELELYERPTEVDAIPMTKQREWERRLLDLSLRNTLLNFRATRSSIPIMSAQLGTLEDALAGNEEFQLLPMPGDWSDTPRDAELYRRIMNDHPVVALLSQEFQHKRLRADLAEQELGDRVVHLYRASRVAMEENGANTLYLALGMLQWYESAASQKPRYAPLVLVPIELVKKTSRSGIVLRARDEEPQVNITLLEMLRQDFGIGIGGLDPLPKDENGVDLGRIFTTIRHAVMTLPRWDVLEAAYVGLFSFSQFVMWNDIHSRAEELAKNKVVASLMSGSMVWTQPGTFPEAGRLDADYHPRELLVPISADSSQMAAIAAAGAGNSFVLHGPPGTGKSQTITNLIANALASGKTILFVAEKMAALTVVQRRLTAIGLDPFSLELHSNKSKKKAVLEQLRMALEAGGTRSSEEWSRYADRLAEARSGLNKFVEALHRRRALGLTLYEAITRFESVRSEPNVVRFAPEAVKLLTEDERLVREDTARELRAAGEACGHPHEHPLRGVESTEYSPTLRTTAEQLLTEYEEQLQAATAAHTALRQVLPIPESWVGKAELDSLSRLCEWLLTMPSARASGLLREERTEDAAVRLKRIAGHGIARDSLRASLMASFTPSILTFDAAGAMNLWRQAKLQWFLPKWLGHNRIIRMLRTMAVQGHKIERSAVEELLADIIRYQEEEQKVKEAAEYGVALLGEALWANGEGDWQALLQLGDWASQATQKLTAFLADSAVLKQLRLTIAEQCELGNDSFLEQHGAVLRGFIEAWRRVEATERELFGKLAVDGAALLAAESSRGWCSDMQERAARWKMHLDRLRDWCTWRRVRTSALANGVAPLVEAYESGRLTHEQVVPAYERGLYQAWSEAVVTEEESLRTFSSRLFEESIARFQETTSRYEALTRQEIVARLSAKVPNAALQTVVQSSELGILERAIRSGGRGVSIRKLFEQIPNLLRRLCPCMLMSPMSVAQYMDPSNPPFDLVVFDEASQMPTCEAIGAMARGREVIVVGDPKQLPPTSFFSSGSAGDGADDDSLLKEDMESVLDDCLALGMPQGHLLWHYRSRHESLIAFSNMQYYENKLLTFPSPNERVSSVRWIPVENGVYDRGRTKQNRGEAEAVVAEVLRRLRDPVLSKSSIGVVTFSSVQQHLIEDMLDEAFRTYPDVETVALESAEPIFVKNLENVQGDERDVILFSIGYGPDQTGKVSLNFGPLNREGGWRRLNVAVSRARHEMLVFSTLRPEQLDTSRTSASGVAGLKAFLEYADKGRMSLALRMNEAAATKQHGLERHVADALQQLGYEVEERVGCSGYRVDVAVVHPEQPGTFLLGIVCDGAFYESASTARDRDMLRMDVLKQLGWNLHQVWSLEWWDNPEKELQRILAAIERAAAAQPPEFPAATIPTPIAEKELLQAAPVVSKAPAADIIPEYTPCVLEAAALPTEAFYASEHDRLLQEQLRQVVAAEGPISRSLLCKRVLQAWGIARAGARIDKRLDDLLARTDLVRSEHEEAVYYWPTGADPQTYDQYRTSSLEVNRRNADELPPEEVAAALTAVLAAHISLQREDLLRETAKAFGYQRSGSALEKAMAAGLDVAILRGTAEVTEQGRVVYVG